MYFELEQCRLCTLPQDTVVLEPYQSSLVALSPSGDKGVCQVEEHAPSQERYAAPGLLAWRDRALPRWWRCLGGRSREGSGKERGERVRKERGREGKRRGRKGRKK